MEINPGWDVCNKECGEDSDENNYYQPDMEYSEIVGLPEEEEIPANRKIKFSCAPIKVSMLFQIVP